MGVGFSSLGPCAEALGLGLKSFGLTNYGTYYPYYQGKLGKSFEESSSSGSHARAVVGVNRLTSNHENLGSPSSSFPPSWGKERMGVGFSSLGPCAEAEGWIDKSINGIKRKDERESDD